MTRIFTTSLKAAASFVMFWVMLESCVGIVSRSSWSTVPRRREERMIPEVPFVYIHHTTASTPNDTEGCRQRVRSIQSYHRGQYGWDDIGYSFLVCNNGEIFEGRGWGVVGAHTMTHNRDGYGVAFIGNFMHELPSQQAIDAFNNLVAEGVTRRSISSDYKLRRHSDVGRTNCPGWRLGDHTMYSNTTIMPRTYSRICLTGYC
ncbi:unnamed protein product [Calicophoron daubneyi]|uniref:Peptidoglycan-recognition protein n=1 Tax=Calicophoron daubneyi TaxID=300641 RepID=A0AAV2T6A6_CALDB